MPRRTLSTPKPSLRTGAIALGILLFLIAISTLPYHFPVAPNFSDSYIFGYNNRVGMAIVALGLLLLACFGPALHPQATHAKPLTRSTLYKALAISFTIATLLYLLTRQLNGFNESIYLIDRVQMLLDGRTPYAQFEFAYGPLFLYLPAWLARALHLSAGDAYGLFFVLATLLGIYLLYQTLLWTTEASAFKSTSLDALKGTGFSPNVEGPTEKGALAPEGTPRLQPRVSYRSKEWRGFSPEFNPRAIFLLFWYATTGNLLSLGTNGSMLRFILPCFFAAVLHRALTRNPTSPLVLLLPLPLFAVLLTDSPELALAFALGTSAYLLLFGNILIPTPPSVISTAANGLHPTQPSVISTDQRERRDPCISPAEAIHHTLNKKAFATLLLSLAGMAALTALAAHLGLFTTLLVFRSGGLNFPITPAPHMLLLFALAGLCACYAGHRLRRREPSPLLLLIFVSAASLVGALGRCDAFHTLMDPFGITLAGCLLVSTLPLWRRILLPIALVVYLLFPTYSLFTQSAKNFSRAALPLLLAHEGPATTPADRWIVARMARSLGPAEAQQKFDTLKHFSQLRGPIDLPQLFHLPAGTVFAAPLGFAPSHFGLYHSPAIDEGYYSETINIATPAGISRVIAELAAHPERPMLILPGRERNCGVDPAASRAYIRQNFLYPYSARVVHPESIGEPLCTYLQHHYHQATPATPDHFGYALWLPN